MNKVLANAVREEKEMGYKYWKVKEGMSVFTSMSCDILTMGHV